MLFAITIYCLIGLINYFSFFPNFSMSLEEAKSLVKNSNFTMSDKDIETAYKIAGFFTYVIFWPIYFIKMLIKFFKN